MIHTLSAQRRVLLAAIVFVAAVSTNSPGSTAVAGEVLTGIDVLQQDNFKLLEGQRVGLITNHTGRNRDGVPTVQLLHDADNVNLVALFSPEHGIAGALDVSKISDTTDQKTGLKVFSLYGETRRPTAEMLGKVDTLVFDIQDIGARFYTYISTMGEAMKAAAEHGVRFVVLDRPNPINGVDIAGPMLDDGKQSFIAFHTIPVRHGMTIGELATMFHQELQLQKLNLHIMRCKGWQRDSFWEDTNLVWINPSPNMRSLTQAVLYPGIGMLETTNISVGRGTDTPFEVIGAPWINARELAAALNAKQHPGVVFVPIEFTPESSKHSGKKCGGVNIAITDRTVFEPTATGFEIAAQLQHLYSDHWKAAGSLRLISNQAVEDAITSGQPAKSILKTASEGVDEFKQRRSNFLLY
jgi:uncharacterized protein YbbC (DUF1343 family)